MPKKKPGRGRGRQPQRRHLTSQPARGPHGAQEQQLIQSLRAALRLGGPLDLLVMVSGLLEVTDPRSGDSFAPDEQRASLADLVESFVGTPYAETTAALTAIKALVADEVLAARVGRELEARRHRMPGWLTVLDQAQLDPDVWLMTHVLGDGDDYLIGVTLPTGDAVSALVYVDHNMGTVVKDAFVVPEPLEDLAIRMGTLIDDADQSLTRTDPATARAAIEAAIDSGSRLYPPLTSDSWPMCRPLVEWMLRMLPTGGVAPEWREWSWEETAAVADEFFVSPFGAALDDDDHRSLLKSVLWFCTGYAPGDPWRWSPVTVEMLLADWFPRTVIAEPAYLAKLPDLVRAYIGYCHDRNDIRADLTAETLAAVGQYEPEYLQLIRSDRQQWRAGLAEALMAAERVKYLSDDEIHLEYIADEVGGVKALMALGVEPLPDEAFDWTGSPEEIQPAVQAILDECDTCARRCLTSSTARRCAASSPERRATTRTCSDARVRRCAGRRRLPWVACTANRTIGSHRSPMTGKELLAHFGITGSVTDRANSLIHAAGIDLNLPYGRLRVGASGLLVARQRRELVDDRDRTLASD